MGSWKGQVPLWIAAAALLVAVIPGGSGQADGPSRASAPSPLSLSVALPLSVDLPGEALTPRPVTSSPEVRLDREAAPRTQTDRAASRTQTDPRGEPTRVVIAAIDIDADLVGVGLLSDGAMQVPDFGLAGWYTEGPKPGFAGPAVIAAHVDSRAGPDVFYRIRELLPGDEIRVTYDSGDEVTFVVDSSDQAPKDQLPVDAIWPRTDERMLTLITCGGDFDRSAGSYRDNIIVYSSLSSAGHSR